MTSFRPSIIFGPGDHFFTRFAGLLKTVPLALPLACPDARFAPVFVGDVVSAFITALHDRNTIGQRYELCGPHAYTLQQLVEFTANVLLIHKKIIRLDDFTSRLQARIMQLLPGKPLTHDNYLTMKLDNICQHALPDFFDLTPTAIDAVVPVYLTDNNERARLGKYREKHE